MNINKTDLGCSAFFDDIFYWNDFRKTKNDSLGHFFRMNRIKKLKNRHETFLLKWIDFVP